jgi:hypothetical protein
MVERFFPPLRSCQNDAMEGLRCGQNDAMEGLRWGLHYPEGKFRADGVAIATKDAFVVVYLGFVVYQG